MSTKPKDLIDLFEINKWGWYVVDVRNWYKPEVVRKHFDNKKQAKVFIEKYCGDYYLVIRGIEALHLKLRDPPKTKRRGALAKHPKYPYPADCITSHDKQIFRLKQRYKMRTDKERPKVTKAVAWEAINDEQIKFLIRLSRFRNNHWAFSDPVPDFQKWKKEHGLNFRRIVILSNIVRCLQKHYDIGPYLVDEVAEMLYKILKKRIDKHLTPDPIYEPRLLNVRQEFLARGFLPIFEANPDEEDNYVCSIHLEQIYVYPEWCWHTAAERGLYDYYTYDLQALIGIPGYTAAHIAGLAKRK